MNRATTACGRAIAAGSVLVLGLPVAAAAGAAPDRPDYRFEVVASWMEGGGPDLHSGDMNQRGDVLIESYDWSTGLSEGFFVARKGDVSPIALAGEDPPGEGGVFDGSGLGMGINAAGDMAFVFPLSPLGSPWGVNTSIYRASTARPGLEAVVNPYVTPAPTGGAFAGVFTGAQMNGRGEVAFTGLCPGLDLEEGPPGVDGLDLGTGVFVADRHGAIRTVASPGDPAPGGGVFDYASHPAINDAGDVAFDAHVMGEPFVDFGTPQDVAMYCFADVYVKLAGTGEIVPIAHLGDPAPDGGEYQCVFDPLINNRGEVMFVGDFTPEGHPLFEDLRLYLHSGGETLPVAAPGDPVPGGGHLVVVSPFGGAQDLNDRGEVTFCARLDTDTYPEDGVLDTGQFVWRDGASRLVARTGTVLAGIGTVAHVNVPGISGAPDNFLVHSAPQISNRGQVVFTVTLTDGRGVLLKASPRGAMP